MEVGMWRIGLIMLVVLGFTEEVRATPCIADAEGVHHLYPNSYASFTRRMPNHKNEKCWFPVSDKHHKRWDKKYEEKTPDVNFEHLNLSRLNALKVLKQLVSNLVVPTPITIGPQLMDNYATTMFLSNKQLTPTEAYNICDEASARFRSQKDVYEKYYKNKQSKK